MKILVTGANGQIGREIKTQLDLQKYSILAADRKILDISDRDSVIGIFKYFQPDIVVNCASYTSVDECEDDQNYQLAYKINVDAVKYLANECDKYGAKFIHFSSDYVFDGTSNSPIIETYKRNPINKYGITKMLSEDATMSNCSKYFLIRTSWLYGDGNNFVNTMLNLVKTNTELNVVNDQIGTPTSTKDLTNVILRLIETDEFGIYHCTNHGECSWYEFAKEIFRIKEINIRVNQITSEELNRKARRPKYSVLDNMNLREKGMDIFRPWQIALKDYLNN